MVGSFDVIRFENGRPKQWLEVEGGGPWAQCLKDQAVVRIDGRLYLKIIDRTHMGNGHVHFYKMADDKIELVARSRYHTNLYPVRFRGQKIDYRDVNEDGRTDIVISATIYNVGEGGAPDRDVGPYYIGWIQSAGGSFVANKQTRRGAAHLHD